VGSDDGRAAPARLLAGIFSALTAVVVAGAGLYYHHEHMAARKEGYTELASIAQLKAQQLERWRAERLMDVTVAANSPFLRRAVRTRLEHQDTQSGLETDLETLVALARSNGLYSDVVLLDPQGRVILSASGKADRPAPEVVRTLHQAMAGPSEVLSDLYQSSAGSYFIDVISPIASESGRTLAFMDLRADARRDLFPMIQSWPSPSSP